MGLHLPLFNLPQCILHRTYMEPLGSAIDDRQIFLSLFQPTTRWYSHRRPSDGPGTHRKNVCPTMSDEWLSEDGPPFPGRGRHEKHTPLSLVRSWCENCPAFTKCTRRWGSPPRVCGIPWSSRVRPCHSREPMLISREPSVVPTWSVL